MPSSREPQQDRSRATRARLLAATIVCLAELGITGTTVGEVASRAGVSRGAAQHHFATRDEMIAAASVHVVEEIRASIAERGPDLATAPSRTAALLAIMAEAYAGTAGRAATALWAAASADPALRALAVPLEREFSRSTYAIIRDVLGSDDSVPGVRETIELTLTMLGGMGFSALLVEPGPQRAAQIAQWAAMFEQVPGAVAT